jgi:arsenite oxidase small subunit
MSEKSIPVQASHEDGHLCMSRRQFLLAGGAMVSLAAIGLPGRSEAAPLHALKADYPRTRIGSLSALKKGMPVEFAYPYPDVQNILVKLGSKAGGGVGAEMDVVAFTWAVPCRAPTRMLSRRWAPARCT